VVGYRLERTREGRSYEELAVTEAMGLAWQIADRKEGWFYRVSAFNARGQGPACWVFFYLPRPRDPIFVRVPVKPGLRVNISELLPA